MTLKSQEVRAALKKVIIAVCVKNRLKEHYTQFANICQDQVSNSYVSGVGEDLNEIQNLRWFS